MALLTQDNRTASTYTGGSRTAVASLSQDSKAQNGSTWGNNLLTWAQETHTWANSIGTLTLDTRN